MLTWLADAFRAQGLTVVEEPGWQTRGQPWAAGEPSAGMQHHTAPPVPFPPTALYSDGRIKCHFNVKPDGTVHVIAAGRPNYSSGSGSKIVLDEARRSIAPSGTAAARGLWDSGNMNPHYIGNETDHLGDGSPIPAVQLDAVVRCWRAICGRLGWPPARIVGHAESTRRKIDPRWNGLDPHVAMVALRMMIGDEEDDVFRRGDQGPDVRRLQEGLLAAGYDLPVFGVDGDYGQETADAVAAYKGDEGFDGDGESLRDVWAARLFTSQAPHDHWREPWFKEHEHNSRASRRVKQ